MEPEISFSKLEEGDLPINFDFNKYFSNKEFTSWNMAEIYLQVKSDGFDLTPIHTPL